ncbi:hypothetical protein CAP35_13605 [Chitinophagaceae bacterium IBVUCB1]|nr:hypothetical protein CAP35_13605 [Chitinophagaceae bacterium IBVUCB1]
MKQWLAYSFLFIFSFQLLPVRQLGQLLYKGQMTEEVYETDGKADENKSPESLAIDNDKYITNYSVYTKWLLYSNHAVHNTIYHTKALSAQYIADVFSPPPNVI